MYVRALTPTTERIPGPLGDGAVLFSGCSSCHGSKGEGGVGYQFSQGEVLKTFPHIEDQLRWVYGGSDAYATAGVQIYGDPKRPGGAHVTKAKGTMPQQGEKFGGQLTEAQILAVVCHERFTLGGRKRDCARPWASPGRWRLARCAARRLRAPRHAGDLGAQAVGRELARAADRHLHERRCQGRKRMTRIATSGLARSPSRERRRRRRRSCRESRWHRRWWRRSPWSACRDCGCGASSCAITPASSSRLERSA